MIIVSHKGVRLIPSHSCIPQARAIERQHPLVTDVFLDSAFNSTSTDFTAEYASESMLTHGGSFATHFVADGMQTTGSMNHVIPLMNTNSNLYTVTWRNISVHFSSVEVSVHRFRRLTLWSCNISLRNLQDLLCAATSLRCFILGGWTSLVRGENDTNTEATLCSTLEHLHVNFSDTHFEDSDWLDSDDAREAQYAVARFFDQAYVVTPSTLREVVLKLAVRDVDVAARLINHALATMERLILAYVDSTLSTTFINLEGGKHIREVHIKCVAGRLHEVVYSLRTISSSRLVDIQLYVKVFSHKDKLHCLSSFDADVYCGRFPSLVIFGVHVDPWSMYDNDVYVYKDDFRKEVMSAAAYLREAKKLRYYWSPDEAETLTDVFLVNTKFDCAEGALSDDDYT